MTANHGAGEPTPGKALWTPLSSQDDWDDHYYYHDNDWAEAMVVGATVGMVVAVADDGDDDTTRTGTNVTSVTNVTPLHLSTQSNCIAVGEALLSAGAEVDAVDRNGNTPLPNAVFHSGGAGGLGSHASRSRVVSSCS